MPPHQGTRMQCNFAKPSYTHSLTNLVMHIEILDENECLDVESMYNRSIKTTNISGNAYIYFNKLRVIVVRLLRCATAFTSII